MISVVIPVYNEIGTIQQIVSRVRAVPWEKEIIIVDDGSTDGTHRLLSEIEKADDVLVLYHKFRQGKGAALRTGFKSVSGSIVIIQDADLEYDPNDYSKLLAPILDGRADIVYGSRFLKGPCRVLSLQHYAANRFLTTLSNMLNNTHLTDMSTCYKVFRSDVLAGMSFRSNRFAFCPEFTAKVARKGYRIVEVPVSYSPRTYAEGKKISWKDGLVNTLAIMWFRFFD